MLYSWLADLVLVVHFAFILFVIFGALLLKRWPWVIWLHLPALLWGIAIEVFGWICPLTPLENTLRELAGQQGYQGGFIEHYLMAIIYPDGLTRPIQWTLAAVLILVNLVFYGLWWKKRRAE